MPRVLTTNATILCPHGGRGTSVASSSKWAISGGLALLANDVGSLACPFLLHPCVGYRLQSMGLNATTIDGRAVILETDFNQTFTGLPLLINDHHSVIDDSTPAPIPTGRGAPPLSPELADAIRPVVTAVQELVPFLLHPCVGYRLQSMGLNATTIDGRAVILETDFNQTFTGLPLRISDHHSVIDDSTPAPIPTGREAPPLSPELADAVRPVVTAVPELVPFNTVSMLPAALTVTFTLASDYPMLRRLTLINTVVPADVDLTTSQPPGLHVSPGGDAWTTPVLTVVVSMTAVFVAGLGIGQHHLFLTGVNRRGLSGYAVATLAVS